MPFGLLLGFSISFGQNFTIPFGVYWLANVFGTFFIALMVLWGMREFAQTHAKVRETLAAVMPIAPAQHRNFYLVTAGVSGVSCLAVSGLSWQFHRVDNFGLNIFGQIYIIIAVGVTMAVFLARNLYFKERRRITKPMPSYLLIWLPLGGMTLANHLIWGGELIILFGGVGLLQLFYQRFNQNFHKFVRAGDYASGLDYLQKHRLPFAYLQPHLKPYNEAYCYYHLGDFDAVKMRAFQILEAKEAINLALANYQQTLNLLGLAVLEAGAYAMARQYFEASLRLSADQSNIYDSLGKVYLRQGEYPDFAIKFFDTAISEAHDSKNKQLRAFLPLHLAGRAWALALLGRSTDVDSTIDTIEMGNLADNAPIFAEYHYRLGQARLAQGKNELAFEHFQQASTLDAQGITGRNARDLLIHIEE